MAKRSPSMASDNAAGSFKAKISESLPLLGFLNNTDKADIWRFWKTVSSAVKIAVNGKGDIVETQRRNSKSGKLTKEKQLEDYRLHHMDTSAITIYVPIKCLEKGSRRFRILKLANQQKIADYFETIHVEGEDTGSEIAYSNNSLEYCDFSELCDASNSSADMSDKIIVQHVAFTESDGQGTDDDLKAVSSFLRENEKLQPTLSSNDSYVENIPVKVDKSKTLKKIWPVGRPTTRSSSGARVIKDKLPESDNFGDMSVKESKVYVNKDSIPDMKTHLDTSEVAVDSLTFYPDIKQETLEESEDFNITIVPMGDSVMHIAHSSTSSTDDHQQNTLLTAVKSESSDLCSAIDNHTYSHEILPDETMVGYRVHVSLPMGEPDVQSREMNREYNTQTNSDGETSRHEFLSPKEMQLQCVSSDQNSKQDFTQGHLVPRSASDIETIISALEEELKKTSEISAISVASTCDNSEGGPSSMGEVSISEIQTSYVDSSGQTVQILQGQEIMDVQHVENVIWTSDGEVILESGQILDEAGSEAGIIYETQPVHDQYGVEYEVLTDKKQKRGRKRKFRDESSSEKASLIDRTCTMCHRVLNYASSMTAHMRIHSGSRPYNCAQCDSKFTTKANRDRHEATHVGLKPFKCNQCSKSFTENRSLKIHIRTHTGERPFVCDTCGQSFTQKCTLLVHMDRHTNKKGHLCDLCGKAFRQKCQLDVHVKRHNRQALYPCHECSTKCYTKGDLVRHMIKHTGERPFQCKLCPRAFTRKQYLVDHENQHYGRKPYRCSVCSATFHDMGSCHRHLKKHALENDGDNSKNLAHSALLSSSDFHRILEGTQIGQILKLGDGSDAIVKAVVSEADGSTVYHITCVEKSDLNECKLSEASLTQEESSSPSDITNLKTENSEK